MESNDMNPQDEGRIDLFDTVKARLEQERESLIAQGVPEEALLKPLTRGDLRAEEQIEMKLAAGERAPDGDDDKCSSPLEWDGVLERREVVLPDEEPKDYTKMLRSDPEYDEAEDLQQACEVMAAGKRARLGVEFPLDGAGHSRGRVNLAPVPEGFVEGRTTLFEAPLGEDGRPSGPFVAPVTKDTNPKDAIGTAKPGYWNVPIPVLYEIGAALLEGALKYGAFNWRVAGVRTSVYITAAKRHLDSFVEGEDIDPDSGLSHITKAIASLVVLRDAQINGMEATDDRPPRANANYMDDMQSTVTAILARVPNPVHPHTEAGLAHMRNTPVEAYGGQILGYEIEVMLPAEGTTEGFVWAQQGSRRTDLDQSLAVAQALRDDGYGQRVVRVTMVQDRVELMADSTECINGEHREVVTTVFPGDASLTEPTPEEATADALEEAEAEMPTELKGVKAVSPSKPDGVFIEGLPSTMPGDLEPDLPPDANSEGAIQDTDKPILRTPSPGHRKFMAPPRGDPFFNPDIGQ